MTLHWQEQAQSLFDKKLQVRAVDAVVWRQCGCGGFCFNILGHTCPRPVAWVQLTIYPFYLATQASWRMGNHGRREAEIEAEIYSLLLTALADTEAERCTRPDPVSRSIVVECRQAWIVYDVLHAIEKARDAYAAAWALQRVE